MKLLSLCILLFFVNTFAGDTLHISFPKKNFQTGTFESSVIETGLWLPKNFEGKMSDQKTLKQKTPVVVWFHGAMNSDKCDKGLIAGDAFSKRVPRAVVVSVSACKNRNWFSKENIWAIDWALDSLNRRGIVFDFIHLVGVSDGGLGVLAYSLLGKRPVRERLLLSTNLSHAGDFYSLSQNEKLHKGTWNFFQGGRDRLYPLESVVPWIEGFCSIKKMDCVLKIDPSGEHDWSWWEKNRADWLSSFEEKLFPLDNRNEIFEI